MVKQNINIGTTANDGTGDFIRDAFDKTNDNFTELYASVEAQDKVFPSQFGTVGVGDDTLALDAAFATGKIVDLEDRDWVYVNATHVGAPNIFAQAIIGAGFTLTCDAGTQFDMPDGGHWSGGKIISTDTGLCDPSLPRSGSHIGPMLIASNASGSVRPITSLYCALDFEYQIIATNGSERGEGFLYIVGTDAADVRIESDMNNTMIAVWSNQQGGHFHYEGQMLNTQTGLLTATGPSYYIRQELYNTPTQQDNFRSTTETPDSKNGQDAWLCQTTLGVSETSGFDARIIAHYPVERGFYIQNVTDGVIWCEAIGTDAGKLTDGSRRFTAYGKATLTDDGSSDTQQYGLQVYGGAQGAVEDCDLHPICINNKSSTNNERCFSLIGVLNDIRVHQPYGYNLGWGMDLTSVSGLGGIFTPVIDGVTVFGGRCEGPGGVLPANGALQVFNGTSPTAGYSIQNYRVIGLTSHPAPSGPTMAMREVTGEASFINCSVDGVNTAADYNVHVSTINCPNGLVQAYEKSLDDNGFAFNYPEPFPRTDLNVNTSGDIVVGTVTAAITKAETFEVEVRASHSSQPQNCYISWKAKLIISNTGAAAIEMVEYDNTHSSQTLVLSFDSGTREIRLNHASTTALGFNDDTFYSKLRASVEVTV